MTELAQEQVGAIKRRIDRAKKETPEEVAERLRYTPPTLAEIGRGRTVGPGLAVPVEHKEEKPVA